MLIVVLGFSFFQNYPPAKKADASVAVSNECNATTTDLTWASSKLLSSTSTIYGRTLCSVIITKKTNTTLNFYDATTTDITLRGNTSTSSITVLSFGSTTPEGVYPIDIVLKIGLIADPSTTGVGIASTTITTR